MNILFLSPLYFPHIGGVETHVREVSKILSKKGHKITIITGKQINYPKIKFLGLIFIWFWFLGNLKLIAKSDLIHVHDVFIWYLPFSFIFPKKPVFVTFHGYETKFPPSKKAFFIRKIAEKLSWGNICVGHYIEKWYGTKADYIIYGGVEILPVNTNTTNKKLRILFIGRLEEDTGIPIYLKALDILKKKGIDCEFEVCGDGSLRKGVEKWGKVHGFVQDLKPHLERSDLIFSSSYLSILQALVTKRLVVAVYDNELKQDYLKMAPFAPFIFIESSPEKLAQKVVNYVANKQNYQSLINDGYQWSTKQTWDKVVDIYESLYSHNRP